MSTKTMNISLPNTMKSFVEERLTNDGYSTISEYIRALIRDDQLKKEQEKFENLLVKRMKGKNSTFTYGDIRKELNNRLKKKNK